MKRISALVDNSIRSHARLVSPCVDDSTYSNGIALFKAVPRQTNPWLAEQIECLPTIARIARENRLELYTHNWLRFEAFAALRYPNFSDFGDIFCGIKFTEAKSPIPMPKFLEISFERKSRGSFIGLVKYFCGLNFYNTKSLRSICSKIGEEHFQDALHLWVSVENNLDYYVTNDKKFYNRIKNTNLSDKIKKRICFPEEILREFQVESLVCMPVEYGGVYDIFGRQID